MSLIEVIVDCLNKVKAKDILNYDMKGRSPFFDNMILASVESERQASAIITYIKEETAKNGFEVRSVDGALTAWVVIDCYDVVVSIFTKAEREHFSLEKIYMDVPCQKVE